MRFIDEATIKIAGGHGGPGCISFRRETFIPRGGPDGGDGGAGGSVIFVSSHQLGSLQDFRFKRSYKAKDGVHGSGSNKAGRDGEDIEIRVPVGTVIRDVQTGEVLVDFVRDQQEWIACKGGRGGKGNAHFTTSTHQAPKFAQPGEEGESLEIKLELKLLADVGIIGFPNAGKSTLISRISAAHPKIADYPFTTLTPQLGVVQMPDLQTFVVADIPGLIEGAHRGAGLGHRFLKHIERTRLFIHLLDGSELLDEVTKPIASETEVESQPEQKELSPDQHKAVVRRLVDRLQQRYTVIRNELGLFNDKLLHKPEMVVINKLDLVESDPRLVEELCTLFKSELNSIRGFPPERNEPWVVSAVTGKGIESLLYEIHSVLKELKKESQSNPVILPDDEELRSK